MSGSFPTARPLSRLFSSPRSETERFRLRILDRLRLLESPLWMSLETRAEFLFDLLDVSVSYISVIGENHQYFLASRGLDTGSIGRSKTPDNRLLYDRERNRVQDTARTASEGYRFLREKLGWRAHASVPLRSPEGFVLGAVGVADRTPRVFQPVDLRCLQNVSQEASSVIEQRHRGFPVESFVQRKLQI